MKLIHVLLFALIMVLGSGALGWTLVGPFEGVVIGIMIGALMAFWLTLTLRTRKE